MAELGQTEDPKALIPGDVGAINENVLAIDGRGASLRQTGTALKGIDTGNYWTGDAANTFRETFGKVPPKWETAGAAFDSAATALNNFAWTLGWAQGQAAEAIRVWREAEEATRRAVDAHNTAVAQAAVLSAVSSTPVEVAPFVDPGVEGRARAQAILQSARTQLVVAGDEAASAIRGAADQAPEKPSLWERAKYWGSEFGAGAWDSVVELYELGERFNGIRYMTDRQGYLDDVSTVAAGLGHSVTHPVEFGKQLIDYDTWRESPARALGHLAPDAVAAAATGGAAAVGKRVGVETVETAARHGVSESVEDSLKQATDAADAATRGRTLRDLPVTDALPPYAQPHPDEIAKNIPDGVVPETYQPYGPKMTPEEFAERYWDPDVPASKYNPDQPGKWIYPENDGFALGPDGKAIIDDPDYHPPAGTRLDRFGGEHGKYLAPEGTPFPERALPPNALQERYISYEVTDRPLPEGWRIERGPAAPYFEQVGGGQQLRLVPPPEFNGKAIEYLYKEGYLR